MKSFEKISYYFHKRIERLSGAYEYQAFFFLQLAFVLVFLLRGLDKIAYFFVPSRGHTSKFILEFFQRNDPGFILAVGIIELIICAGVIFKPKFFAYFIVFWTLLLIISFLVVGNNFDLAFRDIGLLFSALAFARLSHKYGN